MMTQIPRAVTDRHQPLLRKTVAHLPTAILFALRAGLDNYAHQLQPGRLYTDNGGCAVGVMLKTIFPGAFCQPKPVFWLRRKLRPSVSDDFTALARQEVRLHHIEIIFDRSVMDVSDEGIDQGEAAYLVGRWIVVQIDRELKIRSRIKDRSLSGHRLDRRLPERLALSATEF